MTHRFNFNGASNLEPGDLGTIRFAYPHRMCTGDKFVGVLGQGFEVWCRVTTAHAVHLGDMTITYEVEQLARTERGNDGTQEKKRT